MNFSFSEIIVILLIALLVVKPDQLPDIATKLGRLARSMRNMFAKMKDEMNGFIEPTDTTKEQRRERQ